MKSLQIFSKGKLPVRSVLFHICALFFAFYAHSLVASAQGNEKLDAIPPVHLNSLECLSMRDLAERETLLSQIPSLDASTMIQAEPQPSTGVSRSRLRARVGLSLDFRSLGRAAEARALADQICQNAFTRQNLLFMISAFRAAIEKLGAKAERAHYLKALQEHEKDFSAAKARYERGFSSFQDFDAFRALTADLKMKIAGFHPSHDSAQTDGMLDRELNQELDHENETLEISSFESLREILFPSSGQEKETTEKQISQVLNLALTNELKAVRLRTLRQAGDPWNFTLSGGYERLSAVSEPPPVPAYFQAELKLKLGAMMGGNLLENSLNSASEPSPALKTDVVSGSLVRELTALFSEAEERNAKLRIAQERLAEMEQQKQLEEKLEKNTSERRNDSNWNLRKNKIELEALESKLRKQIEATKGPILPKNKTHENVQPLLQPVRKLVRKETEGTVLPTGVFFSSSGDVYENTLVAQGSQAPFNEQHKEPLDEFLGTQLNTQLNTPLATAVPTPDRALFRFTTSSPTMRMRSWAVPPNFVQLRFSYNGATQDEKKLKSGEERSQIGIFMLGQNQCNLVYVMLRLDQSNPELVVQTKQNQGATFHQECGNKGYERVKPEVEYSLGFRSNDRKTHVLEAELITTDSTMNGLERQTSLEIKFNNRLVWKGQIPRKFSRITSGIAGVRSDNADFDFDLFIQNPSQRGQ